MLPPLKFFLRLRFYFDAPLKYIFIVQITFQIGINRNNYQFIPRAKETRTHVIFILIENKIC